MGFSCGIVGLPNVGKSTIFNALTQTQLAQAANYPFCTIDPNNGLVNLPDQRLWVLKEIVKTNRVVPVQLEIVDIAGLVRGASQGAGKGNAFLSHIRAVTAILHVVRCFEDDNVIHVDGRVDPVRDIETIDLELIYKDEETVRGRMDRVGRRLQGDAEAREVHAVCSKLMAGFAEAKPARALPLEPREWDKVRDLQLLTAKPMLFVCNVDEQSLTEGGNELSRRVQAHARANGAEVLTICGKIEEEIGQLPAEERQPFMEALGLAEAGLDALVKAAYRLLGLQTFFTAGEKEARAWQIPIGCKAPQAAGVIHTDFEKGFIRAEVASYDDFVRLRGEKGCREAGRLRAEGRDYTMHDGDVVHFLFNTSG